MVLKLDTAVNYIVLLGVPSTVFDKFGTTIAITDPAWEKSEFVSRNDCDMIVGRENHCSLDFGTH